MSIDAKWVLEGFDELRNESHMSEYGLCELAGYPWTCHHHWYSFTPLDEKKQVGCHVDNP